MRKLLLATAALALLCLPASAQVINRSLQASQDATGPFGVDTNFNLYIQNNRHVLASPNAAAAPTIGTCTSATMTANSTDFNGQLTGAAAVTSCTVNFGQAYLTAPRCVVSPTTSSATTGPAAVTTSTTVMTVTFAAAYTGGLNWFCGSVN